jgi:transcriptional regulator with XRE-family HTH domain
MAMREFTTLDIIIGAKIKSLRLSLGMTQLQLGNKVGVTFQQIQKYEKGNNRISVSMLVGIAEALNVPITQFIPHSSTADEPQSRDFLHSREGLLIMRSFTHLSDDQRNAVAAMATVLTNQVKANEATT